MDGQWRLFVKSNVDCFGIGWSFGSIIKPFKSLVRTLRNRSLIRESSEGGGAAFGHPPWLVWFTWLWLFRALTKFLKGFMIITNDPPNPRAIDEKVPGVFC